MSKTAGDLEMPAMSKASASSDMREELLLGALAAAGVQPSSAT